MAENPIIGLWSLSIRLLAAVVLAIVFWPLALAWGAFTAWQLVRRHQERKQRDRTIALALGSPPPTPWTWRADRPAPYLSWDHQQGSHLTVVPQLDEERTWVARAHPAYDPRRQR